MNTVTDQLGVYSKFELYIISTYKNTLDSTLTWNDHLSNTLGWTLMATKWLMGSPRV